MKRLVLAGGAVLVASAMLAAQQIPSAGDLLARIPGLDKVLAQKDALTTSLETATNGVPWLDLFEPATVQRMDALARTADGGFDLGAGSYQIRVQSFCLQPGTHRPAQGDGFLDAPLAGPRGAVVQHILEQAARFPGVQQDDVQMLLWSILARAKISDLPRELQTVAGQLLTPAEISQVNGGALGLIASSVRDAAFDRLPPAVARVLSAEADLRDLVSRGTLSYADMESIAVPSDADEPDAGEDIPASRWNFRDGLYVRYQPNGYQESLVQVYVPAASKSARAMRDAKGRLSRLIDPDSRTIDITYDEARQPLSFDGDPGVRAWAITHIAYTVPAGAGGGPKVNEADVEAWTLVGVPNGKGRLNRAQVARRSNAPAGHWSFASFSPAVMPARPVRAGDDEDLAGDLQARYNRAARDKGYFDKATGQGHKASASDVLDEGHYRDGIDKVKKLDFKGEGKWINQHNESIGKLAAQTHCELTASCAPDGGGTKHFNPAGKVGVPASGQRIGMSGRTAR